MANQKLSALFVARASKRGRYCDGKGLYLQVAKGGSKSWLFRYMRDGKARAMGLGPAGDRDVTLAAARGEVDRCRQLLRDGIDPIEARRKEAGRRLLEAAKSLTFKEAADKYVAAHEAGWRNDKHRAQWRATLATYVLPTIGELSVAAVDTSLVLKILEPIWRQKPETAKRVRGRIEAIFDWAKVRGHCDGENPARWKGHLDKLLPSPRKVRAIKRGPCGPASVALRSCFACAHRIDAACDG